MNTNPPKVRVEPMHPADNFVHHLRDELALRVSALGEKEHVKIILFSGGNSIEIHRIRAIDSEFLLCKNIDENVPGYSVIVYYKNATILIANEPTPEEAQGDRIGFEFE